MQIPREQMNESQIQINEVFDFKGGIPGFEQYTKFVVFPHDDYFSILQSSEEEELAFIITNPFLFFEDYEFELSESDLEEMGIQDIEDVIVRSIVTWGNTLQEVTANLMAPLIFNAKNKTGKQVVLYPTLYKSKHPLLREGVELKGGNV